MKTWKEPELKELNVRSTEYHAKTGQTVDGQYLSYDGQFAGYTYSGPGEHNVDYNKTN